MATDVQVLITRLDAYRESLISQRLTVTATFLDLTVQYAFLRSVWMGAGADSFDARWQQVAGAFDDYRDGMAPIIELLQSKTDELRCLDTGMGG